MSSIFRKRSKRHESRTAWKPPIRKARGRARSFIILCIFAPLTVGFALGQNWTSAVSSPEKSTDVNQQVIELRTLVEKLQARVEELEKRSAAKSERPTISEAATSAQPAVPKPASAGPTVPNPADAPDVSSSATAVSPQLSQTQSTAEQPTAVGSASDFLHGTTLNFFLDGYYGYNFNNPIGRTKLLRAYDVSSNAFSLNQAGLVIENAADPERGKPFGFRLDFQYGQATETLQGNPVNEPRPEIYRNIFQAYGTYVVPVGKGLTVDFVKFASSL